MQKISNYMASEELEINQLSCISMESCRITKMKHHSLCTILTYPVRYGKFQDKITKLTLVCLCLK